MLLTDFVYLPEFRKTDCLAQCCFEKRKAWLNLNSMAVRCPAMQSVSNLHVTRKLSYRKDNRAMRPMYRCTDNFRESLTMPTATFPEIFNGLLFRLSL